MKKILIVMLMLCLAFSAFADEQVTTACPKTINLSANVAAGSGVGGGDNSGSVDPVYPVVPPTSGGLGIWVYYDVAGAGSAGNTTLDGLTGVGSNVSVSSFDLTGANDNTGSDNIYIYLVAASNVSDAASTTISLSSTDGWKYGGTAADSNAQTKIPLTFTDYSYHAGDYLTAADANLTFNEGTTGTGVKISAVANSSVLNKTIVSRTKVGWTQSTGYLSGDWSATITVAVSGS